MMPRPIQPTVSIQLAEFLAASDPRCSDERHTWTICARMSCPACHFTLRSYQTVVPRYWPDTIWPELKQAAND